MMGLGDDYLRSMRRFTEVSQLVRAANELSEAGRMSRMSSTFDDMRELLRTIPPQSLMLPPIGLPPEVLDSVRQQLKGSMGLTLSDEVRRSMLESVTLHTKTLRDLQLPASFASMRRLTSAIPSDVLESLRSPAWESAFEQIQHSAIELSPDAVAALTQGVSPLLSDERGPEWDEEEGALVLAELTEVVEAATPALVDDLADAQTPEDRVRAFVNWWRSLPPLVQLVFALLLQWATLGLSSEYLKDQGMLPGLKTRQAEE